MGVVYEVGDSGLYEFYVWSLGEVGKVRAPQSTETNGSRGPVAEGVGEGP